MNHSIFKDLLPNYIDGLTSEETNRLMQDHMNQCEKCSALYESLKDEEMKNDGDNLKSYEFDAFKKVKKSNKKKIIWAILSTLLLTSLVFGLYTYLYSTQWVTNSDDVVVNVKKTGKTANIHISAKNENHYVLPSQKFYIKNKGIREYKVYEARKGLNTPVILDKGFDIPITFIDKNTILNEDNEKEKIDDKDVIVLNFKDKNIKISIIDLYNAN
ncbi:anti-sigma factor family protein [Macrococcus animalis]|uniref:anti-sigma factor family protein n=1 Tax=Macrococcus animalis TaxID=3395467 RepID=UPI0039BE42E9